MNTHPPSAHPPSTPYRGAGGAAPRRGVAAAALLGLASLLAACLPSMHDTKVPSSDGSYSALAAEAEKLGWKTERSREGTREGSYFWMLKVRPTEGGVLYFTKHNGTGQVSFACDELGRDACIAAANRLLEPAFHGRYE